MIKSGKLFTPLAEEFGNLSWVWLKQTRLLFCPCFAFVLVRASTRVHASMRVQVEERCIWVEVYSYRPKRVYIRDHLWGVNSFFPSWVLVLGIHSDRLARQALSSPPGLCHQPFDLIFEMLADFSNIKEIPLNSRNTRMRIYWHGEPGGISWLMTSGYGWRYL